MANTVNTHIVGSIAVPEFESGAYSNDLKAYQKSIDDIRNSFLHPVEEVRGSNKSSLERRIQTFEGFADENMPAVSRSNVNGTVKIAKVLKSKL